MGWFVTWFIFSSQVACHWMTLCSESSESFQSLVSLKYWPDSCLIIKSLLLDNLGGKIVQFRLKLSLFSFKVQIETFSLLLLLAGGGTNDSWRNVPSSCQQWRVCPWPGHGPFPVPPAAAAGLVSRAVTCVEPKLCAQKELVMICMDPV